MKKDQKYFFKRCRLCGRCYKGSVDIFLLKEKNLQELIHQCLNINVREDDALPKKLCQFCDKKLMLWEKFKNSCESIQVKLIADSLPKKVEVPKGKKNGKTGTSADQASGNCSKSNSCDSAAKLKPDSKWDNEVVSNQSWSTAESIQHCVESAIAILGPKMEQDSQADCVNLLNNRAETKDAPNAITPSYSDDRNNSVDTPVNSIINAAQNNKKQVLEITDQEINDLNDTISMNLNSDVKLHERTVVEINNNLDVNSTDKKTDSELLIKNLQRLQHKELKLKSKKKRTSKEYSCKICKKIFHSQRKMKSHCKSHAHEPEDKKHTEKRVEKVYQCPHCPRKLSTSFNLRHHLDTHSDTCNFCCHVCGKLFRTNSSLLNHLRVHICDEMKETGKDTAVLVSGHSVKLHQCEVCDKKFRQSGHLAHHLKTHTGIRLYNCGDCGMSFTEKYQLRKHTNAVHEKIKKHTCNVCGKKFLHTHNFRDHMLQHEGIASVSCDLCGKAFLTSNALNRHRRLHTGEKPFVCDICGKAFRDCSNRKRHRDKHLREAEQALSAKKPSMEDSTNPLTLMDVVEEPMGKVDRNGDGVASDEGDKVEGKVNSMMGNGNVLEEEKTKKTYMSLKTYFESSDVVSLKDDGDNMVSPMTSNDGNQNGTLLQPLHVTGKFDDSSNPLFGGSLFSGEELDLNSDSLLLIGDGRVNNGLMEGTEGETEAIKDQLVWVPSSNEVQGDVALNGIHSGDITLSSIQNGDITLNGIQGDIGLSSIQSGDITGILEVGMGLCGDFDVNSAIELETGKDGLPVDFPSISEIKEAEENDKALDNVLCLQVF